MLVWVSLPATLKDPQLGKLRDISCSYLTFELCVCFLLLWFKFHITQKLMLLKDVIYLQHDSSWCKDGSRTVALMRKYELQARVPAVETEVVKQGTNMASG